MDPNLLTPAWELKVIPASTPSPPAKASGTTADQAPAPAALEIKRERLAGCIRELLPLIRADWEENGIDRDRLPLDLSYDRYLDLDLRGTLLVFVARDDGLVVGFVFVIVHEHIDHVGYLWGLITWYYVHPGYRRQGVGSRLLDSLEGFLKEHKVRVIEASEKVLKRHGLFASRGYAETDVIYRKVL